MSSSSQMHPLMQARWQVSERDPQRLEAVKRHVAAMYEMINAEKDREEREKKQEVGA